MTVGEGGCRRLFPHGVTADFEPQVNSMKHLFFVVLCCLGFGQILGISQTIPRPSEGNVSRQGATNTANTNATVKYRKISKEEFLDLRSSALLATTDQLKTTFEQISPDEVQDVDLPDEEKNYIIGILRAKAPADLFTGQRGEIVRFALGKARGIQFGMIEAKSGLDRRHYSCYLVKEKLKWVSFVTGEFTEHPH